MRAAAITDFDVTDHLVGVLTRRLGYHLGQYALARGIPAASLVVPTIDVLAAPGKRLRTQKAPCVLAGVVDYADDPVIETDGTLTTVWEVLVEIIVEGADRRDVLRRRGIYDAMTLECLMQRVPLKGEPIDGIEPGGRATDDGEADAGGFMATAAFTLWVTVREAMSVIGAPPDDESLPDPGTPGGPALPGQAPVPWPAINQITDDVELEALDG